MDSKTCDEENEKIKRLTFISVQVNPAFILCLLIFGLV
jgi:hypothetical protein